MEREVHLRTSANLSRRGRPVVMERRDNLLAGLQQGDEAALHRVAATELPGLYPLALSMLRNEADAEDACQEVLLRLLRAAPSLPPDVSLRAWLRRVCVNYCLDRRRALRALPTVQVLADRDPPSPLPGPDAQAEQAEFRHALLLALGQLPERQRAVFALRHFQGCSLREIANSLGCAEGTVKSHLSRAVRGLRSALGEWRLSSRKGEPHE